MKFGKKIAGIALTAVIGLSCFGCASNNTDTIDYADDEVIPALSTSLQNRWKIADETSNYLSDEDALINLIEVEQKGLTPYLSRQFEDTKLQEIIISYNNLLDETKDVVNKYGLTSPDFWTKWLNLSDKKATYVKELVDNYGLTVDSKYEKYLQDITRQGGLAIESSNQEQDISALVSNIQFELVDSSYGLYKYEAIVENSTPYSFESISIAIDLYDENGVKEETTYASVDNWASGEKAKISFSTYDFQPTNYKVYYSYYSLV